jgi:hypothetical protein
VDGFLGQALRGGTRETLAIITLQRLRGQSGDKGLPRLVKTSP